MKKPALSTLFIIAGILFLIAALGADDINYAFAGVGFGLITIGISQRKNLSQKAILLKTLLRKNLILINPL